MSDNKAGSATKKRELKFDLPDVQELLKAGVQFGHQTKRWNPAMQEYIFGSKNGIHIIDVIQTRQSLKKALDFLVDASSRGNVVMVGTKRQARKLIEEKSIESGAFFVTHRWVGGLLTNNQSIKRSLKKLQDLETVFEEGVEGRTKFEVSRMKKEWERLNRLYRGIKELSQKPTAVVVLDVKYERNAVREARAMNIPVVAVVDTNTDPNKVDYPIPGNDDAVSSIELFLNLFAEAIKQGNEGKGIRHEFKDYSKLDVEIKKQEADNEDQDAIVVEEVKEETTVKPSRRVVSTQKSGGILENVQRQKEAKKIGKTEQEKKVVEPEQSKDTGEGISSRTQKALDEAGVSLSKAKKMKKVELLKIKGIGPKALKEILG